MDVIKDGVVNQLYSHGNELPADVLTSAFQGGRPP